MFVVVIFRCINFLYFRLNYLFLFRWKSTKIDQKGRKKKTSTTGKRREVELTKVLPEQVKLFLSASEFALAGIRFGMILRVQV